MVRRVAARPRPVGTVGSRTSAALWSQRAWDAARLASDSSRNARRQAIVALRSQRRRQAEEGLAFPDVYVDADLVFAQEDGSPTHPERLLDAFNRLAKAAGLRPTTPHDLRHGWATRALEAGVPAKVVQEVLGHSSAMVTLDVYSHVVLSMTTDATQLVADLVLGKR